MLGVEHALLPEFVVGLNLTYRKIHNMAETDLLVFDVESTSPESMKAGLVGIALALLGNSHPVGVVLSSLLFAFLRSGAPTMQVVAGTPVEIIRIIQGLVIVFVAAPEIMRGLYHLNATRKVKKAAEPSASKS